MKNAVSVVQLAGEYRNEICHAEHVACLALRVFDRTARSLGMPASDRALLEAACLLHDIAYSIKPADHAEAGARLILRRGLSGFTKEDLYAVAAAVAVHQGRRSGLKGRFEGIPSESLRRGRRLAAILRVADGLDHAHLQSASITAVRKAGAGIRIIVSEPCYRGNIRKALEKADLWRRTFRVPLDILPSGRTPVSAAFPALMLGGNEPVLEAVRRYVCFFHRTAQDNMAGCLNEGDENSLHDLRVSLRRIGAVLRMSSSVLDGRQVRRIRNEISRLCDAMGAVRDNQTWEKFLVWIPAGLGSGRQLRRYCSRRRKSAAGDLRLLANVVRGGRLSGCMAGIAYLGRIYIPERLRRVSVPTARFDSFAASVLSKKYGKFIRYLDDAGRLEGMAPAAVHELRRRCRRLRYAAEFACMPARGRAGSILALMKRLTDSLGHIHDIDAILDAGNARIVLPAPVREYALEQRAEAMRLAADNLSKLRKKKNSACFRKRKESFS